MKKLKYQILFVILFMTIGIAAVTTNVVINGNTNIAKNPDDFNVYFSDVFVNGTQDLSLVRNDKTLVFNKDFSALKDKIEITYDVTNGSKDYDAQVSIDCTPSTEYLTITNDFDTDINLAARSTKTGVLTVTLSKTNTGADVTEEISCTITANAVERTSQGSGSVASPLERTFKIGEEITIGEEKFNVIDFDETTVTMLAQQNINDSSPYKQTDEQMRKQFSDDDGWEYEPGPKEIDIQEWDGDSKVLLNNYVSYLETEYGIDVTGNLITVEQLGDLGCTVPNDYSWGGAEYRYYTCTGSEHSEWLINGQYWWTRSAYSESSYFVWMMLGDGTLDSNYYYSSIGVRPTVTISKEVAEQLLNVYPVGKEIAIDDEKFNVISDNGTTVTILAQYNLSPDYRQSTTRNYVKFADTDGWEYSSGPKEIDIQTWSTNPKTYVNAYVEFLRAELEDDSVTGGLITLTELKGLGCTINDDYSSTGSETCENSSYKSWLVTDQYWWTRSASSANSDDVWYVNYGRYLNYSHYSGSCGVRPVITISKSSI